MKSLLLTLFAALTLSLSAQIQEPVTWSFDVRVLENQEFELIFTADIEEGWKIYSQYLESDDGPVRTSFYYDQPELIELIGKNRESGDIKEGYDDLFGMNVVAIAHQAVFSQKIKSHGTQLVAGYLEFMACNDEMCLPPTEVEFAISLPGNDDATTTSGERPLEADGLFGDKQTDIQATGGILKPVTWTSRILRQTNEEVTLQFEAEMDEEWTLYSKDIDPAAGPHPTTIHIEEGGHVVWSGNVSENGAKIKEGFDEIFGVDLKKIIEGPVLYTISFKVLDPQVPVVGSLSYMTCNDHQCLPTVYVDFVYQPQAGQLLFDQEASDFIAELSGEDPTVVGNLTYAMSKPDLDEPLGACSTDREVVSKGNIWGIFGLGFIGGLLALLTPCVFPMIPLTVSFFTKSTSTRSRGIRDATLYGGFILLVYLLLSIPFHLMDSINPDILNDISTNIWLNLIFFAVFMFFAFSFFGYYELTLPEKWTNRASQAEGIGGILGIFFMALTLALVSFSCTGPILGSLLAGALTSDGGAWQLTAGMGGFGLALALPFALFAMFPNMMSALPKSGGWLNTVKVFLGFLELALALKFLSNADLVKHWGILKIEPFLGLWILIFLGLGAYLFGWIKFPHDSPVKKLSWGRMSLGVVSFAFVAYLASGFIYSEQSGSYRPLKLLSGLAPPVCYSWVYDCDCPQNLDCFKDLEDGLAFAKKQNKPVMIDFTGHACVNCRKMEEHVWPEREVYNQLRDDYVLISLYVDDKRALPESEQIVVEKTTGGKRKLRRVGDKWAHFQTEYFQTNTQPYYVLLSPSGEQLLNQPVGYTPDAKDFADFLQCGQEAFKRLAEK